MGCVLGQYDKTERKEHEIYYLSKRFTESESRYSLLERTICDLVWVATRFRHYLLSYTVYLIARMDPLKYIFERPVLTGKISKWQMLLTEFDIVYVTQKQLKARQLLINSQNRRQTITSQ